MKHLPSKPADVVVCPKLLLLFLALQLEIFSQMRKESIVAVPLERRGFLRALYLFQIKTAELQRRTKAPQAFWLVCLVFLLNFVWIREHIAGPFEGKHLPNVLDTKWEHLPFQAYKISNQNCIQSCMETWSTCHLEKCNTLIYLFWSMNSFSTVLQVMQIVPYLS